MMEKVVSTTSHASVSSQCPLALLPNPCPASWSLSMAARSPRAPAEGESLGLKIGNKIAWTPGQMVLDCLLHFFPNTSRLLSQLWPRSSFRVILVALRGLAWDLQAQRQAGGERRSPPSQGEPTSQSQQDVDPTGQSAVPQDLRFNFSSSLSYHVTLDQPVMLSALLFLDLWNRNNNTP